MWMRVRIMNSILMQRTIGCIGPPGTSSGQLRMFLCILSGRSDTGLLASVTRDDKIWQGSKYRGIVYYHFAYHFGGKFKLYLVSLLRYGNPTCAIDWFNVPNTVKRKLSFLKTFSKIWTVYHNFNIFSLF